MSSVGTPDPNSGWLSDEELAEIRRRLPLLYVEAVPVRVDGMGKVTEVGMLPASPVPFSVAEYFPWPGSSQFMDARQHAVSLAYVVPVTGTCEPRQDALEITWLRPAEAASESVTADMEGGRGSLLRAALASVGVLP